MRNCQCCLPASWSAERVAGPQVLGHVVEGGLRHADTGRGDPDPPVGEGLQGDLQAAALGAEEEFGADPDVVEDDVGGDLALVAELAVRGADRDPGCVGRDDERRQPAAGAGQDDDEAGRDGVGDPPLAAVEHPAIAVAFGAGGDGGRGEVGRRSWLRRRERTDDVPGDQRLEPALALLACALVDGVTGEDAMHVEDCRDAVGVVGELLDGDRGRRRLVAEPIPVHVCVERDPVEAFAGEGAKDVVRKPVVPLVLVGDPCRDGGHDPGRDVADPCPHVHDLRRCEQVVVKPVGDALRPGDLCALLDDGHGSSLRCTIGLRRTPMRWPPPRRRRRAGGTPSGCGRHRPRPGAGSDDVAGQVNDRVGDVLDDTAGGVGEALDLTSRAGRHPFAQFSFPHVLGAAHAGVVAATGEGLAGLRSGQHVAVSL